MKMLRTISSTSCLLIAFALSDPAFAHGGTYRGPGDTVPPGGSGTGGGGGPAVPGPGGSAAPGSGPGTGSPASPGGPPGGPGGAPTGGPVTSGGGGGTDLTIWDFWWGFNKDPYLNLQSAVHDMGVQTGSDQYFLGEGERDQSVRTLAPSPQRIREEVVPALIKALNKERSNDILSGALIALAKIGDQQNEEGVSEFEQLFIQFLADANQELAETAAIAIGILANDSAAETLAHLARDTERGRVLVGRKVEVPYRTRSFAAFGLGLLGARTATPEIRQECAAHLVELLQHPHFSTRDIKVAAMTALGLCPVELVGDPDSVAAAAEEEPLPSEAVGLTLSSASRRVSSSRQAQIAFLLDYFDPDRRRANTKTRHEYVIAHAPRALARLLPTEGEQAQELKRAVWEGLSVAIQPRAKERREIVQGVVLALGQIGDADADEVDAEIRDALARHTTEGDYQQDRYFAIMALAQAGSRRGQGEEPFQGVAAARTKLLQSMTRGRGQTRPWSALALGVFGEQLSAYGQAPDPATSRALREAADDCKRPGEIGAYALALGLRKDLDAEKLLKKKLERMSTDEARGYCAVALGLLGQRSAQEDIQAVVKESKYRPDLIKQAAIGLGLLGDKSAVEELVGMLRDATGVYSQAALASALGTIGDDRSLDPLLDMLQDNQLTDTARGFAAVALGIVCDKEPLPWNSKIAVDINYRANTTTLTGVSGTGVLDIL